MSDITPCIRCGKLRIVAKSWSEKISGSLTTYTQTVCPDHECQKVVEIELQKKRDKIAFLQNKLLERRKESPLAKKSSRLSPEKPKLTGRIFSKEVRYCGSASRRRLFVLWHKTASYG